jgi:hypothetical protein
MRQALAMRPGLDVPPVVDAVGVDPGAAASACETLMAALRCEIEWGKRSADASERRDRGT